MYSSLSDYDDEYRFRAQRSARKWQSFLCCEDFSISSQVAYDSGVLLTKLGAEIEDNKIPQQVLYTFQDNLIVYLKNRNVDERCLKLIVRWQSDGKLLYTKELPPKK